MRIVTLKRVIILVLVTVLGVQLVVGRTYRMKRLSDSHLADLETKIAMNNKIKGFLIKMPVGGGRLDPSLIGRRRRSDPSSRLLIDKLLEQQFDDEHAPFEDYSDFIYNNYIH